LARLAAWLGLGFLGYVRIRDPNGFGKAHPDDPPACGAQALAKKA